jgi:hypothetical protein
MNLHPITQELEQVDRLRQLKVARLKAKWETENADRMR